jgi:uncharacterized ParB-like nuclease family protein
VARTDFGSAKRKASWKRLFSFVTGRPTLLLPFELVRERLGAQRRGSTQTKEIDLANVVGSVNRYREFDREFLPLSERTAERWEKVRDSLYTMDEFPPIDVYEIEGLYYVVDGNHRVSVARRLGHRTIKAHVVKFQPDAPVGTPKDIRELILKAEYRAFLKKTRLDALRPEARIECTRPEGYRVVLDHIDVHRYFRGIDLGHEMSYEDAVMSWYDNLYLPIVTMFREYGLMERFPDRKEADLYVWVSRHLYLLGERQRQGKDLRRAAERLAKRYEIPRLAEYLLRLRL